MVLDLQALDSAVVNHCGAGCKANKKIIKHLLQWQHEAGILLAIAPEAAQGHNIKGDGNDQHGPHAIGQRQVRKAQIKDG